MVSLFNVYDSHFPETFYAFSRPETESGRIEICVLSLDFRPKGEMLSFQHVIAVAAMLNFQQGQGKDMRISPYFPFSTGTFYPFDYIRCYQKQFGLDF